MVEVRLSKTLKRTRTIDGFSQTLAGQNYTSGTSVYIDLPASTVSRRYANKIINFQMPVSKSKHSTKDPKNTLYDYKRSIWTWEIRGKYIGDTISKALNFVADCKLIFEDGGVITLTYQDKTYTGLVTDASFISTEGRAFNIEFTITFMEGEERV